MDIFSQRTLQELRSSPQHRHIRLFNDVLTVVYHVRVDNFRDNRLHGSNVKIFANILFSLNS